MPGSLADIAERMQRDYTTAEHWWQDAAMPVAPQESA